VKRLLGAGVAIVALLARPAAGQVGYPPERSPFVDVEQTQEITALFGYYSAKRDPARVAPQSAAMAGLQYEWRASGPLHLGLEFMGTNSERTTLDPSKAPAARDLGTSSHRIYAADAFLAVSLTGARSWHHLMPMTNLGLGLVSDFKGPDVGGFKFGTRFAFPWGAGVRWVPGGHIQLRADVKDWMYSVVYPESYYISSTTDPPILTSKVARSRWTNNFAMTVGVSYFFSH
jgi:opacity protein-like surface antigen